MYHHSFLFVIVSDNRQIIETIQEVKPLEDCDYTFQTMSRMPDEADFPKLDVAFVYDGVGGAEVPKRLGDQEECILVAENGNALLTDRTIVSNVSEIWVMPAQEGYDHGCLTVYFQRLAMRMKHRADARKQKICFDTLLNSVPDISWFKDTTGAHLIVNDSFCDMVGKTKKQIYKKGHCYIWNASKQDEAVCLSSDQAIMESRGTKVFEESVKTRTDTRQLKSYKSALIDEDGEIFGTCGIAHDVTELQNINTELELVLDSVPFAVLVEDMHGIVLNKNARFDLYFPQFADIEGKPSSEWKQSLSKRTLLEDKLMEVVLSAGEETRTLVFEEEPIQAASGRTIGQIVTLTDITLERSISQQNEHMANTDYLTGVNNRKSLMSYLADIYTQDDVTLIMIDLDNFKQVNDTYGHEAGDRALVRTAEIMQECFREDFCSRMGGDEFMIVTGGKPMDEVKQLTKQLMDTLCNAFREQKEFRSVTASIGIVSTTAIPEHKRSVTELLEIVDGLLYTAKKGGKNCYCAYGETIAKRE